MDDTWLEPGVFQNAFATELVGLDTQKLWSHDQKKTLKKFNMNKATEEEVAQINADINAFYSQFTQSMMNLFGKVSFKRFNEFIERL